ncbi:hypothetical protein C8J57DRAFT_1230173 [Mycena rebaudengoi]|nr:hypothetical protein C8J57DRAFT_1230173 [Mycena rebaudengoi]
MCDENITYDAALNIAVKEVSYRLTVRYGTTTEYQLVPVANPMAKPWGSYTPELLDYLVARGELCGGNTSGDIVLCEAEHLEEFVDGAGGTVTDLAQLFDSERYQSLRACDSLKVTVPLSRKKGAGGVPDASQHTTAPENAKLSIGTRVREFDAVVKPNPKLCFFLARTPQLLL